MNILNWLRGKKKSQKTIATMFPKKTQDNGFPIRTSFPSGGTVQTNEISEPDNSSLLTGIMLGEMIADDNGNYPSESADMQTPDIEMGGGDFGGGGSGGSWDDNSSSDNSSYDSGSDSSSYDSGSSDSSSNSDY